MLSAFILCLIMACTTVYRACSTSETTSSNLCGGEQSTHIHQIVHACGTTMHEVLIHQRHHQHQPQCVCVPQHCVQTHYCMVFSSFS